MAVVGIHSTVISNTVRTAEVGPFKLYYEASQKVKIVDVPIIFMSPYTNKYCVIIMINMLSVPSTKKNLVPPFVVIKSGLQVNINQKIHSKELTI